MFCIYWTKYTNGLTFNTETQEEAAHNAICGCYTRLANTIREGKRQQMFKKIYDISKNATLFLIIFIILS